MSCSDRIIMYYKEVTPIILGICVGIALNLILTPFIVDECFQSSSSESGNIMTINQAQGIQGNINEDDYEPRINLQGKPKKRQKVPQKLIRPRYYSTELNIREKLFVGVLTSRETLSTMGVAINKTLTHLVSKTVFFIDASGPEKLNVPLTVVGFTDDRPLLKPFHMFRYIKEHYLNEYNWFFIVRDTAYIRGSKLMEFISHISISKFLYMGEHVEDISAVYCTLDAGILFSQSVMIQLSDNLDWCINNAFSKSDNDNIGRCVLHSASLPCTESIDNKMFGVFPIENDFEFDASIKGLAKRPNFREAISVFPVTDPNTIYKLHRFFCELELEETYQLIGKLQDEIVNMSYLTPFGRASATWPVGVQEEFKPINRFDVIRWNYFTETHVYLDTDINNIVPLIGVYKKDVDEVMKLSIQKMMEKYQNTLVFRRLINGYHRFDPIRGMEYILDLAFRDKTTGLEAHKRVKLIRPLSHVEVIPMPYVTENSRVTLILPITLDVRDGVATFLDAYSHTCLESQDNTMLMLVFIYHPGAPGKGDKDDIYGMLKSMVNYYDNKHKNGARMAWVSIKTSGRPVSQFAVMDIISKKFSPDTLLLLCSVNMELNFEYLNRVRMNTIKNWQVFFPIPFVQYKPNIVYQEKTYPNTVEINQKLGHYDNYNYELSSFYNSDYLAARKYIENQVPIIRGDKDLKNDKHSLIDFDLFNMFLKTKLHIFRAVEPALKLRFHLKNCNPSVSEELYQRCLLSRSESLATRAQLARLIFQHQRQLDHGKT